MPGMEIITVTLALALVAAAGMAAAFALAWRRGRGRAPQVDPNTLVEQVVRMAGQSFRTHLDAGHAELARDRDVFEAKWDPVVSRVNEELSGIRGLVTELQKDRAAQHEGLAESLRNAADQRRRLIDSTRRLNDILGNSQARGQWGERMADDILRAAGMIEGVNYRKQLTTSAGTRPDFSFDLPDGRLLHMDVKFPLEAYSRYVEATSDLERRMALRDFGTAVLGHVRTLASRETYMEPVTTVGYVLMFVPNDGVYAFINEHHRNVFDEALQTRVVICSPATLFAMLALVRQAMDTLAMERSSREILDHLACFADQWHKYVEKFDLAGRHLARLNSAFDELSSTRRNQLERQLDRIEELKSRSGQEALEDAVDAEPASRMPRLMVT